MKKRNLFFIKSKAAKVLVYVFVAALIVCCLAALSACGVREKLTAPINLDYDAVLGEITWDEVKNSTGGYRLEIIGVKEYVVPKVEVPVERDVEVEIIGEDGEPVTVIEKQTVMERHFMPQFSLPVLDTGIYHARVKAITVDTLYYRDSDWSVPKEFEIKREAGITYRLINNSTEYEVESIGTANADVIIFETYEGLPVTSIGPRAFAGVGASRMTSIVIGPNVTRIGPSAFLGATRLSSITFPPKNLVSIGANAFQNCISLKNVVIPDSVMDIGPNVFQGCRFLEKVVLPEDLDAVPAYIFAECTALYDVTINDSAMAIGAYAFRNCTSLKSLSFPEGIATIGSYAFYGSGLEHVTVPAGIRRIERDTFYGLFDLLSITIPSTVTSIAQNAFTSSPMWENSETDLVYVDNWLVGCKNPLISNAIIEAGTVGICDLAFNNYPELQTVEIPDTVIHVGRAVFEGTPLWKNAEEGSVIYAGRWAVGYRLVSIPVPPLFEGTVPEYEPIEYLELRSDTLGIGYGAFANRVLFRAPEDQGGGILYRCYFDSVALPAGLKSIGDYAFNRNMSLENINLPVGLRSIGDRAFYDCSRIVPDGGDGFIYPGVRFSTVPESVTNIGAYAFGLCRAFTQMTVPSSITRLNDGFLYGCIQVTNVTLHNGITSFGYESFAHTYALRSLTIPNSVTHMGGRAFNSSALTSIVIPSSITSISEELFFYCEAATITLPDTIKRIGTRSFHATAIESIKLPAGLKYIGAGAFSSSNLLSIDIPEGITRINDRTFFDCKRLTYLTLPSTLRSIGDYAFYGIGFMDGDDTGYAIRGIRNLVIPEGVTRIGRYAFYLNWYLTSVILPKSLTSLGEYAFLQCFNLASITIGKNIAGIGAHVFWDCFYFDWDTGVTTSSLTVYTDAPWRQEFWSIHWNSAKRAVIWNCTLSEDKSYVVSFTMDEKYEYSFSFPDEMIMAPYRTGHTFAGWSLAPNGPVKYTAANIISAEYGEILYAVWNLVG